MLKISRLSDYATRILCFLAEAPTDRVSATQLAEEMRIAVPTVSKVLKLLHDAKLVNSLRGVTGGYQLACLPQRITIANIIAAIDGEIAMTDCSRGDGMCEYSHFCELQSRWRSINDIVVGLLKQLTLHDLLNPAALKAFQVRHAVTGERHSGEQHV